MIGPEYFLHASNITRVFSFGAKDVLWLRILAILASLIGLPYFYLQPVALWEPMVWAVVFMTINAYHVWRLSSAKDTREVFVGKSTRWTRGQCEQQSARQRKQPDLVHFAPPTDGCRPSRAV
jgi:hypothetical protein